MGLLGATSRRLDVSSGICCLSLNIRLVETRADPTSKGTDGDDCCNGT